MMRVSAAVLLVAMLVAGPAAGDGESVVRDFVGAFNRLDVEGMLELTTEDVRWISVGREEMAVQSDGRKALREAMTSYFTQVPTARAEIRSIGSSGPFVHTLEEAFWQSRDGEQSRCSIAVYELEDGRIGTAWYFPAHECP